MIKASVVDRYISALRQLELTEGGCRAEMGAHAQLQQALNDLPWLDRVQSVRVRFAPDMTLFWSLEATPQGIVSRTHSRPLRQADSVVAVPLESEIVHGVQCYNIGTIFSIMFPIIVGSYVGGMHLFLRSIDSTLGFQFV